MFFFYTKNSKIFILIFFISLLVYSYQSTHQHSSDTRENDSSKDSVEEINTKDFSFYNKERNDLLNDGYADALLKKLGYTYNDLISEKEILADFIFRIIAREEAKDEYFVKLIKKLSENMAELVPLPVKITNLERYINRENFMKASATIPPDYGMEKNNVSSEDNTIKEDI